MRQPRTDRLPVPPPAFQQSTHKNQSTSFLPNFPEFCKCKTVSISCQNSANFIRLSGAGRPRGALVPCPMPVLPNLLRPIALRRKKQWYADTMPAMRSAQILPQSVNIVPCIQIDVKVWNFPPVYQNFCLFFWKSVALICATSALNSRVYVWYISCRETYHLTELERSAIGAGCKMPQGTPGRKGSSSVIFFSRKSCIRACKPS